MNVTTGNKAILRFFLCSRPLDSQAKWQHATQNFAVSIQVGSIITAPPILDFANSATTFNVASPSLFDATIPRLSCLEMTRPTGL
jgi:hypothetical protein